MNRNVPAILSECVRVPTTNRWGGGAKSDRREFARTKNNPALTMSGAVKDAISKADLLDFSSVVGRFSFMMMTRSGSRRVK